MPVTNLAPLTTASHAALVAASLVNEGVARQ